MGPLSLYSEVQEVKITHDQPGRGRVARLQQWVLPPLDPVLPILKLKARLSTHPPHSPPSLCGPGREVQKSLPRASVWGTGSP